MKCYYHERFCIPMRINRMITAYTLACKKYPKSWQQIAPGLHDFRQTIREKCIHDSVHSVKIYIQRKSSGNNIKTVVSRTFCWRRRRDLNPRYPFGVYTISNRARSASYATSPYALPASCCLADSFCIIQQDVPFVKGEIHFSSYLPGRSCCKNQSSIMS